MKPVVAASMPLHFIVLGKPTWRRIRKCRERAKEATALYAGATCHIWHGKALRDQIRRGLGEEVAAAFDALPSNADAATLASWCILYVFGGMFHAPGLRLLAPMTIPEGSGLVAFNDVGPSSSGWAAINPAILWSLPGRHEWTLAIDMKIKAGRQAPFRHPQSNHVILGRALGMTIAERGGRGTDDQWIGQVKDVSGAGDAGGQVFVTPDGTIVALLETS